MCWWWLLRGLRCHCGASADLSIGVHVLGCPPSNACNDCKRSLVDATDEPGDADHGQGEHQDHVGAVGSAE